MVQKKNQIVYFGAILMSIFLLLGEIFGHEGHGGFSHDVTTFNDSRSDFPFEFTCQSLQMPLGDNSISFDAESLLHSPNGKNLAFANSKRDKIYVARLKDSKVWFESCCLPSIGSNFVWLAWVSKTAVNPFESCGLIHIDNDPQDL